MTAPKVHVRIVHDNVSNASHPVLVGHYRHDVIVGAERYLDQRLDGRLSALLRMELYAGLLNTAVVVLNDQTRGELSLHPGAIIAGLGVSMLLWFLYLKPLLHTRHRKAVAGVARKWKLRPEEVGGE